MNYVLSDAADADLRGIFRHTLKQWGSAQVLRYRDKLEQGMARLAARQEPFRNLSAIYPTLCMAHCAHHSHFLPACREDAPALVVAVFHERMDLMARLAEGANELPELTGIKLRQ